MTFGTESNVLQRFTTLDDEIQGALDDPGATGGGTHMYDAALRSIGLIRDAHLQGGFLVVLSDGTDHGSSATSDQVVAAARAAHVRIYTVGLESSRVRPGRARLRSRRTAAAATRRRPRQASSRRSTARSAPSSRTRTS